MLINRKRHKQLCLFLFETTAMYYDKYGRVVQSRATNHLGGYDLVYNELKFTGAPARTLKTHNIAGQASVVELYTYDYDKAQRPTTTKYSLNGGSTVTLASNTYDELGTLSTNNRHNGADLQSYVYNIRNWPTKITSGSFEENLYYNKDVPSGATANYNGNIAYSTWTYNGVNKGYSYVYDGLNRLTSASFKQGSSSQANGSFDENFSFDKMGNILALQRKSNNKLVDDLTLHYTNGEKSNQIDWITDAQSTQGLNDTKEYQDISKATSGEFAYDANGNMIKDLDRDIYTIKYNVLNLPDAIQFKNGNQIINSYDASGHKLGTEYFTWRPGANAPVVNAGDILNVSYSQATTDQNGTAYIGNIEYNTLNGNSSLTTLSRIYNDEGYVENPANPQYYYFRHDHLGDNREVWLANTRETVQRTQYYPSGLPWAYNRTLDHPDLQHRKYNGKEFVEMHGYDTYDYGARGMYPALDILPTVDPLAEKYYSISPYVYCAGNPVNLIDPDGMDSQNPAEFKNIDGGPNQYVDQNNRILSRREAKEIDNMLSMKAEDKSYGAYTTNSNKKDSSIKYGSSLVFTVGAVFSSAEVLLASVMAAVFICPGDTPLDHKNEYKPAPADLPGFPGAQRTKAKAGRARWNLPNGDIGEWDSQHGEVEVYDKTGKKHKGAYDPKTGEQKKKGEKNRKTESK
jgi:RHS repeat-associated protein